MPEKALSIQQMEDDEYFIDFKEETMKVESVHKQNVDAFNELIANITKTLMIIGKNPIIEKCILMRKRFVREQKERLECYKNYNNEYNLLVKKLTLIKKSITSMEEMLHSSNQGDSEMEVSKYKREDEAFTLTEQLFSKYFGLQIKVENQLESKLLVTVIFNHNNQKHPVGFTIDSMQREIMDFDSTLISEDEKEKLKEMYLQSRNVPQFVCALRRLIVSK